MHLREREREREGERKREREDHEQMRSVSKVYLNKIELSTPSMCPSCLTRIEIEKYISRS